MDLKSLKEIHCKTLKFNNQLSKGFPEISGSLFFVMFSLRIAILSSIISLAIVSCQQNLYKGTSQLEHKLIGKNIELAVDAAVGGRVASFKWKGTEMLKVTRDKKHLHWGSTVWPAPQSAWDWPPPKGLDKKEYIVETSEPDKIVVSSYKRPYKSLKVRKTFELMDEKDAIRITYEFLNEGKKTLQFGIWENTRVNLDGDAYWKSDDHVHSLSFDDSKKESDKIFIKGSDGWLAFYKDGVLMVKQFPKLSAEMVALDQAPIEIYYSKGIGLVELENHGEYQEILPGKSISMEVVWSLKAIDELELKSFLDNL